MQTVMGLGQSVLTPVVEALVERKDDLSIQDKEIWEKLWPRAGSLTSTEYTGLFTRERVTAFKSSSPKNLATVIRRAVVTLSEYSRTGVYSKEAKNEVLHITMSLYSILPSIMDDPSWVDFWNTPTPVGVAVDMAPDCFEPATSSGSPPEVQEEAAAKLKHALAAIQPPSDPALPLYVTLMNAIMDLLFCPHFTCLNRDTKAYRPWERPTPQAHLPAAFINGAEYIWYKGVMGSADRMDSVVYQQARCELLRLLLVCLSGPLYIDPSSPTASHDLAANQWLTYFVGGYHRNTLPLTHSLLNAFLSYDAIGTGMPYNHVLSPDVDRLALAQLASHVLSAVVDFMPHPIPVHDQPEPLSYNVAVNFLASLTEREDLEFLSYGISTLLTNPLLHAYLPSSYCVVEMHDQLLLLLWRLCEVNKSFLQHIMSTGDVLKLMVPILHRALKSRDDISASGHQHMAAYLLLLWSSHRNFGVRLNKTWDASIPFDVPFSDGNHADLLLLVLHTLLTTRAGFMTHLYEILLTVIVNVTPYIKSLSLITSNKLVHLFQLFSTPKFLLASPNNNRLVFFLLESFNNLVQYQFEGNQQLVYVLVRRRELFQKLAQFAATAANDLEAEELDQEVATAPVVDSSEGSEVQAAEATKDVDTEPESVPPAQAPTAESRKDPEYPSDAQKANVVVFDAERSSPTKTPQHPPVVSTSIPKPDEQEHFSVAQPPQEVEWRPSREWLEEWASHLPLATIMRLLKVLVPLIESMCAEKGVTDEAEVIEFLKNGTMVGLLPVPHPIVTRKYQGSARNSMWVSSYAWSLIFLQNVSPALFFDTNITLFHVVTK
eukprot:m.11221 g.11221  ORF g.11221 m.11221 type:complete len:829 (-) comp5685_c0_seq2:2831-5317(-)